MTSKADPSDLVLFLEEKIKPIQEQLTTTLSSLNDVIRRVDEETGTNGEAVDVGDLSARLTAGLLF